MPAIPSLRQIRITVILPSVFITLLLLRNNLIPLHQSSNFVLSPLNHLGLGIIFLGNSACLLFFYISTGAVDISSVYSVLFSEASSIIYKNPSYSDNISILCSWFWLILLSVDYATHVLFLPTVKPSIIPVV